MKRIVALAAAVLVAWVLTPSTQMLTVSAADSPEAQFLKDGPKLYTMDEALKESAKTGKPVLCWMGPHLFAEADARQLSKSLGTTTLQAAMDSDGEEGKIDPKTGKPIPVFRVKFSTNNYKDGETIYVPLSRMSEPGMAEKILAKVRGGN